MPHDLLRQAEFGDAVDEHAADLVQGLEHGDLVPLDRQIAGAAQSGRPAADDRHFFTGRGGTLWQADLAGLAFEIGDEPLEIADRQRAESLGEHAGPFALVLLWADAAGHGGHDIVFANLGRGFQVFALQNQLDEIADLHAHRAAVHALGIGAAKATLGFVLGDDHVQAKIDFLEIVVRSCGACSGIGCRGILTRSLGDKGLDIGSAWLTANVVGLRFASEPANG